MSYVIIVYEADDRRSPGIVVAPRVSVLTGRECSRLGCGVTWGQQQQPAGNDQRSRCRQSRIPNLSTSLLFDDLHGFEGIRHLSAAIEAAHVCTAQLVLVRPRRVGMHAVKQVSPNPSQHVHISSTPARPVRAYRRLHKLLPGGRLAAGMLCAAACGTPFR